LGPFSQLEAYFDHGVEKKDGYFITVTVATKSLSGITSQV
jgi:hypothetical protein